MDGPRCLSSLSTLNGDWLLVPYSFIHICGFRIEARREIYGGNGLGVALSAIISMFALSNVSKVSSIGISRKLVCKTSCTHSDRLRKKNFAAIYGYNLWHTSRSYGH